MVGARGLRWAAALALVVGLGGCRAELSVEVEAGTAGDGRVQATVSLDREAAAQVGDLAGQLRVDDLEAAGWQVAGPEEVAGGGVRLRATKAFSSPAGADRALDELTGPDGAFGSLRLARSGGPLRARTTLSGRVDLSAGIGAFGDERLQGQLGNATLGLDPAELARELGQPLDRVLAVELAARLPGSTRSDAPSSRGGLEVWPVPLGTSVRVSATSTAWDPARAVAAALAVACGLALVAVIAVRAARRRP